MSKKLTADEFIAKAREIHGNKYKYSNVKYVNRSTKVCIICPEHGKFWQRPDNHLKGFGCSKCSGKKKYTAEEFIEKAREIHGNKYDYSKVEYVNSKTKVCIICPEHGEFWQSPDHHLRGQGCPKCGINNRIEKNTKTREEFIKKAREVHGNKYNYSNVNYINCDTKVCIVCPIHGEFWQTPNAHLSGQGCPKCGINNRIEKNTKTREEFIKKAREVHGNKYDYSKVVYKSALKKVCIVCPIHGEFWQTPNAHLHGQGCIKCGYEKNAENQRSTREEFIEKAREVHGDKYDYSNVEYVNNHTKVCIICPIHGEFWQTPHCHLSRQGCPICRYENVSEKLRSTREEFIEKAREVHGDKYDYSKVEYVNNHIKVCIICPIHGEFWQKPNSHLNGQGCPRCNESHLERDVNALLVENNIVFETQKTFKGLGQQKCDFYISSLNTIIECQGGQHFEYIDFFHKDKGFETEQKRDIKKHDYLVKNGYKIIYYTDIEKYDTFLGEPLIKNLEELKNKLNI